MHQKSWPVLIIASLLSVASCQQNKERDLADKERSATLATFKPITYHRSGGLSASDERITIDEKGNLEVSGKFVGNDKGPISEYQKLQLARLFAGWNKLAAEYRPANPVPDGYVTEIRYGDKTVIVYDGAKNIPELFNQAKERLESTARQIRAGR